MKTTHIKTLVAVILINLAIGQAPAHANTFADRLKAAKEKLIEGGKKAAELGKDALDATIDGGKKAIEFGKEVIEDQKNKRDNHNPNEVEIVDLSTPAKKEQEQAKLPPAETKQEAQQVTQPEVKQETRKEQTSTRTQAARGNETHNSLIELEGRVNQNVKWILFSIKKGSFEEKVTVKAEHGSYRAELALRDGPGVYNIQIFKNELEDRYVSYSYLSATKVTNHDDSDTSFFLPSIYVQSTDDQIIDLAREITANDSTDEDMARSINLWIVNNIKYDYASFNDGSYAKKPFDALDTLNRRMAVCQGYANLYAALARAVGLKAKVITGTAFTGKEWAGHAWNEVLVDGEWQIVDSTWNNPRQPEKYFFIDESVFARDHKKDKENPQY